MLLAYSCIMFILYFFSLNCLCILTLILTRNDVYNNKFIMKTVDLRSCSTRLHSAKIFVLEMEIYPSLFLMSHFTQVLHWVVWNYVCVHPMVFNLLNKHSEQMQEALLSFTTTFSNALAEIQLELRRVWIYHGSTQKHRY
jgi:hypothetical protein